MYAGLPAGATARRGLVGLTPTSAAPRPTRTSSARRRTLALRDGRSLVQYFVSGRRRVKVGVRDDHADSGFAQSRTRSTPRSITA